MIQIKLLKKCQLGKRNAVVMVSRNIAHGLIEQGLGKIYKPVRSYRNRMFSTKK